MTYPHDLPVIFWLAEFDLYQAHEPVGRDLLVGPLDLDFHVRSEFRRHPWC